MEAGEMARLRKATRTGRPLGSEDFVTELETRLERPLKLRKTGPAKKTRAAAAR
jgi:putative transposase